MATADTAAAHLSTTINLSIALLRMFVLLLLLLLPFSWPSAPAAFLTLHCVGGIFTQCVQMRHAPKPLSPWPRLTPQQHTSPQPSKRPPRQQIRSTPPTQQQRQQQRQQQHCTAPAG
jgi:hypothetical protein